MAALARPRQSGAVPTPSGDRRPPTDPVLVRRERYRAVAGWGQRVGYLLIAAAVVLFVIGFVIGFAGPVVPLIVTALVVGSIVLLPGIILGYAVRAADREDREAGRG